jgi:hypothetical protein
LRIPKDPPLEEDSIKALQQQVMVSEASLVTSTSASQLRTEDPKFTWPSVSEVGMRCSKMLSQTGPHTQHHPTTTSNTSPPLLPFRPVNPPPSPAASRPARLHSPWSHTCPAHQSCVLGAAWAAEHLPPAGWSWGQYPPALRSHSQGRPVHPAPHPPEHLGHQQQQHLLQGWV